jgi:hypothetical protein
MQTKGFDISDARKYISKEKFWLHTLVIISGSIAAFI